MTDYVVKSGTSIKIPVTFTRDNAPVDLTDLQAAVFTAKDGESDPDELAVLTGVLGGWVEVVDAALGTMLVTIPPESTSGFARARRLQWDLKAKEADDRVSEVDSGTLFVEVAVRRAL